MGEGGWKVARDKGGREVSALPPSIAPVPPRLTAGGTVREEAAAAAAAAARTARGRSSLTLLVLVMAASVSVRGGIDRPTDQQLVRDAAIFSSPLPPFPSFFPPSVVPAGWNPRTIIRNASMSIRE